jgi:hypothetical protein
MPAVRPVPKEFIIHEPLFSDASIGCLYMLFTF